jgi:eukaryotic-like serine/threonine-protein kinase
MSTPPPHSPPHAERIKLLYMRALALPNEQRDAFLRLQCADEPATLAVLRDMLGLNPGEETPFDPNLPPDAPRSIGPYRILRRLGEGGFGVVWLGEQREPVARVVAIKSLKMGMDSKAILARFEQERAALAVMDHPSIARVLDAGADERGLPYFVMEYVDGQSIIAYCDAQQLTIADRLALFAKVCAGVHHAHTKGVIHRDLKPGNILVTTIDGVACPKIIDFGIAKALDQTAAARSIFTELGQLVGTLEYMSPEQAALGRIDIDTRSDVYSLGVVLYELLTGRLPFPDAVLRERAFEAMLRCIREQDPPHPSRQLRETSALVASQIASNRQSGVEAITRELRRELEWIPLMAMRKSRDERYASVKELGEDIARYLAGDALKAGPESRVYRARKFVKRNRTLVVSAGAISVALIAATGISLRFAASEARARAIAQDQRDVAEETLRFLNDDMLLAVDPERDGATVRVADILRRARETIRDRFVKRPQVQARIQQSLGRALLASGEAKDALPLLEQAHASSLAELDANFRDQTSNAIAEALYRSAKGDEAICRARELVADATARLGATHPQTMNLRNQLGGALRHAAMKSHDPSQLDESEFVYRAVLADRERVLGASDIDTYSTRQNLCLVMLTRARQIPTNSATARSDAMRAALAARQQVTLEMCATFGVDEPETLVSQSEELGLLGESGQPALAVDAFPALLDSMTGKLGLTHWRTIDMMGRYAWCLGQLGKHDLAMEQILVALACSRATHENGHPTTMALARYLGLSLREQMRHAEAARTLDRFVGDVFDGNTTDTRLALLARVIADECTTRGDFASAALWRARSQRVPTTQAP